MTARSLAASLAMAAVLALPGLAPGQDRSDEAKTQPETKAAPGKDQDRTADGKDPASDSTGKKTDDAPKVKFEKATFGGGCFWCIEAVFERIPGVKSAVSGYAGGTVPRPSYEMVCTGLTGHAEVVQVVYDPEKVPYEKLLDVFWACHDPTTLNRQGPDFGTQYRSIILYHSDAQKQAALKSYRQLTAAGVFDAPIVTQLVPYKTFYPADRHHQDYYRKNRNSEYCQMQIAPKLMKLHLPR